ncbi:MAG TPA: MopE-related protein, partial [Cytophagales bacterium]|nr:MopE-related protein [Cytophagales bacterium]
HPGATELEDHIDNDCDGLIDEDALTGGWDQEYTADQFKVIVYPVPAIQQMNVYVEGFDGDGTVTLLVTDERGIQIEMIEQVPIRQNIVLGSNYPSGLYLIQAIRGTQRKTVKVVKM